MSPAGDVVDVADNAVLENVQNGARVILDVEPIASLQAVAIYGDRAIVDQVRYKQRNYFLGILIWPIRIAAACDQHGRTVRGMVGQSKEVRPGFAGGLRATRTQRIALEGFAVGDVPVDFVGRYLQKSRDRKLPRRIQQHQRAQGVGPQKGSRLADGAVDVGFGSEVQDGGGPAADRLADGRGITDVPLDEAVPGILCDVA